MRDRIEERAEDLVVVDEIIGIAFIGTGATVWVLAALQALLNGQMDIFYGYSLIALLTIAVIAFGWYDARVAASVLGAATAALIVWGAVAGWELGVWALMSMFLIVPCAIGTVLFAFAEHEEEVIENVESTVPVRAVHA